jgi:glycosyltransferase involved in cell wall biosynthesis
MKILFLNTFYAPDIGGGAEVTLQEQVQQMRDKGHTVAVACLSSRKRKTFEDVDGVKVWRVPCRNVFLPLRLYPNKWLRYLWQVFDYYNVRARLDARKILKEFQPDVVSCHNLAGWSISVWSEIRRAGVPIVQVLHDQYLMCPRSAMYKNNARCATPCITCRAFRAQHKRSSRQVSAVVGVSDFVLNKFLKNGYFSGSKRRLAIRNARKPGVLPAAQVETGEVRFGFIGSIIPPKGLEQLIRAFIRVADAHWRLFVAGRDDTPHAAFLKEELVDERIIWLGHQKPADFFSSIDVTVVPSVWDEPLGMVAVESIMAGRPAIVSTRGGLPEIVTAGKNGLIFSPDIDGDLDRALLSYAANRQWWKDRAESISDSVTTIKTVDTWAGEWHRLYLEVAKGG